jgi:hypothetical protein
MQRIVWCSLVLWTALAVGLHAQSKPLSVMEIDPKKRSEFDQRMLEERNFSVDRKADFGKSLRLQTNSSFNRSLSMTNRFALTNNLSLRDNQFFDRKANLGGGEPFQNRTAPFSGSQTFDTRNVADGRRMAAGFDGTARESRRMYLGPEAGGPVETREGSAVYRDLFDKKIKEKGNLSIEDVQQLLKTPPGSTVPGS